MRRAAMQRGVIAILDVGTSKIACLILRFDGPERLRETEGVGPMAGQSTFRVIGAATTRSRGVRFGATVVIEDDSGARHRYRIVGDDEADVTVGKISWGSPLARSLIGAKVGETVKWRRPAGDTEVEIVAVEYR